MTGKSRPQSPLAATLCPIPPPVNPHSPHIAPPLPLRSPPSPECGQQLHRGPAGVRRARRSAGPGRAGGGSAPCSNMRNSPPSARGCSFQFRLAPNCARHRPPTGPLRARKRHEGGRAPGCRRRFWSGAPAASRAAGPPLAERERRMRRRYPGARLPLGRKPKSRARWRSTSEGAGGSRRGVRESGEEGLRGHAVAGGEVRLPERVDRAGLGYEPE